jgi:hypothetical protein
MPCLRGRGRFSVLRRSDILVASGRGFRAGFAAGGVEIIDVGAAESAGHWARAPGLSFMRTARTRLSPTSNPLRLSTALAFAGLFGTSAVVYPAAELPRVARQHVARVVEVNTQPTPVTPLADWALRGRAGEVLPELVQRAFGRSG